MNLSTIVSIPESEKIISSTSKIFLIGSCFSDNIGERFLDYNFMTSANPFGTVFNPISVSRLLDIAGQKIAYDRSGIEELDSRYFHYDYHSSLDGKSIDELNSNIVMANSRAQSGLQDSNVLIITFGTSIVYHHRALDKIVSNCHKVPSKYFERKILTTEEMKVPMQQSIDYLLKKNPNLQIILTVSPVRHTKEGLVDNNLSKSRLIDLCHQLKNEIEEVAYFPSYEIMMDELRDYRYYKSDLIHPSKLAVDIIWERFRDHYCQESALHKISDFTKLNRAVSHRPFDRESNGYRQFCKKQLEVISVLEKKYPEINFRMYRDAFAN